MLSYKAALAASVCLLPLQAFAQSDTGFDVGDTPAATAAPPVLNNWIQIGGQYNSSRGAYLGRFNGESDPGFYGLGDFHYLYRDPWQSGGTDYFSMDGANMGQTDRSFNAKVGQQGTWGLSFSYDGIPYYATNQFKSIWQGNGALMPGVAPGSLGLGGGAGGSGIAFRNINNGTPGATTALGYPYPPGSTGPSTIWQPVLTKSLGLLNYNIGTQRDVFTGTGKFQWNDWTITASMRHEHKEGTQANSLNITGTASPTSSSLNTPVALSSAMGYFAQPVDYDTDRYDIMAAYSTQRFQAQVGYTFNNFTDNVLAFNATNPYALTTSAGVPATTLGNLTQMFAPYVLPPSNSAHQIKAMFGYNFSPTTRINANFAYGVQMQNAAYDTATGNSAVGSLTEPHASMSGLVQTFYGNVAAISRPISNLDLRLAYTIDERDNQSPRNTYTEDHNGVTAPASWGSYSNVPFSYNHQTMVAEAGYRILPRTKITLNDTFETTYRNYANASFVTSNTVSAKVRSQMFEGIAGALSFSHQDRDAHNYNNNFTWGQLKLPENDPAGFLQYFETSRIHDDVKATIDLSPLNNLSSSFLVKFSNDTYPRGSTGLRNNHNLVLGPDFNWQVMPGLSAHAFYNYQEIFYEQSSLYESNTTGATLTAGQFIVPWNAKTTDSVHTLGATLEWQAIRDELKFNFDYNLSYGATSYALGDSVAAFVAPAVGGGSLLTQQTINMQPLPDVTSMLSLLSVHGEYAIRPGIALLFGYAWERFSYKDFMTNVGSTQYANILLPGTMNPNESVHIVSAAVRVRF
jgi:MtrB/PioB family decaheme-associated outer membrane protein